MELTAKLVYSVALCLVLASHGLATGASDDVRGEVGTTVYLPCRVDTAQCGELHSVKWYRDNHRVYVFSHVANIRRPEGDGSDRMEVEYTPNSSVSRLHIKDVEVTDEAMYKCEKTYLEVRENCDVVQVIKLRTLMKPQSVRILDRGGSALGNATILGPFNEGTDVVLECEAAGAKPVPQISWYNGSDVMNAEYSKEEDTNGVGLARSKLRVNLQRGDLFAEYKCVVNNDALEEPIVSWLKMDVNVPPTKLDLSGVKSHVVQGTNVLLRCNVYGARPAANVTWYNGSEPISPEMIETSTVITNDGTFVTQSELVFAASRYENGQTLTCEAENKVLKEQMERPLHEKLTLEVLYPPIVTVSPENITVNEAMDILFLCSYVANPAKLDSVKWFKNDQLLVLNDERFEGGTVENPPLIIKNVTRDDMGEYKCELKNRVGSQDSWNWAGLNVLYPPRVELKMQPSNIVKAVDKDNVTVLCDVASGNPDTLLKVKWYLGGDLLKELPDENCTNDVSSDRTFCDLDPSRLLLEYVAQNFAGNYSCQGMNEAGWGPLSNETELIVYYPPSEAIVRYEPERVIKKSSVTLYCSVEVPGIPENTQYMWLRGNHVVRNATKPKWTISPVTFEADSNFTCIAYNEGGKGPPGTVNIKVLAPPAFILPLQPYTGALMNSQNINISCRIECSPMCAVTWLKNGKALDFHNLYYVNNTIHPPDLSTYDFESVQSILFWNMSAWPSQQLDRLNDNANYTCQSSSNNVGHGVTSTTLFAVEYPPENITVSNKMVAVIENHIPQRVICNAKAHPEVSYTWYREMAPYTNISKTNALALTTVTRASSGYYVCKAFNKHGSTIVKTYLNVHYKPECVITQTEYNGNPALVCTAHANPREVTFTWRVKGMNETPEDMRSIEQQGKQSYLILDANVDTFRTYVCYANNSVDVSMPCERDVAGSIVWWKRLDNENLLIIIAIIVGIIVCVVIVCIIIIIVCRRKRANNKYNNPVELEEREKPDGQSPDSTTQSKWPLKPGVMVHVNRMHNLNMRNFSQLSLNKPNDIKQSRILPKAGRRLRSLGNGKTNRSAMFRLKEFLGFGHPDALPIGVYQGANGVVTFKKISTSTPTRVEPATVSRKRKKPGEVPNQSNTADKNGNPTGNAMDPLADPENKTLYENLPFHGMQNPPNKPVSIITPFIQQESGHSTSNLNISTKSLVHPHPNQIPTSSSAHATKVKRNQSFHGFQSDPNIIRSNQNVYPVYSGNLQSIQNSNLCWSNNQIRGNAIGPLILAPRHITPNRMASSSNLNMVGQNTNYNTFGNTAPSQRVQNIPFCPLRKSKSGTITNEVENMQANTNKPDIQSDPQDIKTNQDKHPNLVVNSQKTDPQAKEVTNKMKTQTKKSKKFSSLELRKHSCNSPMFYSVRCRKHGKKRTIFELYAVPLRQKSKSTSNLKSECRKDCSVNVDVHKTDFKTNVYQNLTDSIQIMEQNSENNVFEVEQAKPKPAPRCKKSPSNIYQNIAFLLKITPERSQNDCNALKEDKERIDKLSPSDNSTGTNLSPTCKTDSQTSSLNISMSKSVNMENFNSPLNEPNTTESLEVNLAQKQNEHLNNTSLEHKGASAVLETPNLTETPAKEVKHKFTPFQNCRSSISLKIRQRFPNSIQNLEKHIQPLQNTTNLFETINNKNIKNVPTDSTNNTNISTNHEKIISSKNTSKISPVKIQRSPKAISEPRTTEPIYALSTKVPQKPKTEPLILAQVKRPVPIKPKDFANPALIPKMPILDTHKKWNAKPLDNKNPFYTLTTPQLTSSNHQQLFASTDQLYSSSTFPYQRQTKLVPRTLFPDQQQHLQQQISKSKSFSSRTSKQKKHFQIPLQKCHSFKFQTAESYFQPIKNIHEENLMRNGYQSDYSSNYSRDMMSQLAKQQRDKHKANAKQNSAILRRASDTKYRENMQFHENIQNSVQLQYPQPLYAAQGAQKTASHSQSAQKANAHCTSAQSASAPSSLIKKNGVVYADLDKAKFDKKRSADDLKRSQKNKTEYATLKFNEVGQEIDV